MNQFPQKQKKGEHVVSCFQLISDQYKPEDIKKANITKMNAAKYLKHFKQSKFSKNVNNYQGFERLNLNKQLIGIAGIQNLILYDWTHIQILNLGDNNIQNQGLKILMKLYWPNLKQLYIYNNNISNIKCLSQFKLSQLTNFQLQRNKLNIKSVEFLLTQVWKQLKVLSIGFVDFENQKCWTLLSQNRFQQFSNMLWLFVVGCQSLPYKVKEQIYEWRRKNKQNRELFWYDKNGDELGEGDNYPNIL